MNDCAGKAGARTAAIPARKAPDAGTVGREPADRRSSMTTDQRTRRGARTDSPHAWPGDTLARVPYWVYQDEANYQAELRRIFEGPDWNYVCLESDIGRAGDYRTTFVGEMPVIVVRGEDGAIHAFENRCAHRGALIALDDAGHGQALPVRLPRVDVRPVRATSSASPSRRAPRQGRHARVLLQGRARPAQAPDHDAVRPGLRHALATPRRRSRSTSATRCARRLRPRAAQARRGARAASPRRCRTTGSSTWRT